MTQINVARLVDNIGKTNIYTPIVEAIVNSLDAIEETNRDDGEISITLIRTPQKKLKLTTEELTPITAIEIRDNGIGFNDKNLESFNTIYTDQKIRKGGKGFGRFIFLKYFKKVNIESVFNVRGSFKVRSFEFVKDNDIIKNEETAASKIKATYTLVSFQDLKKDHVAKLDKKLETVARKLVEFLLTYFALDEYKCPKIIVQEEGGGSKIVLNDYIGKGKAIENIAKRSFVIESKDRSSKEKFKTKIFKIFYGEGASSINLVADNRPVTEEALHLYVPEFRDDFYDVVKNSKGEEITKNYIIKIYVFGKYLDENVSPERGGFNFESGNDLFHTFSQSDISEKAALDMKELFATEVKTRQDKKLKAIQAYVDEKAPWHKTILNQIDLTNIPYGMNEAEIENELQKAKFEKERSARNKVDKILENGNEEDIVKQADELVKEVSDLSRSELIHYVALRRVVLNIFKKSLTWGDERKYEKEKVIHEIIFPTSADSDHIPYDNHNLWILDERLNFNEYLASDKPLKTKGDKRPDIVVFDNRISVRGSNDRSNPIVVFEFKRPQRDEYADDDNPLKQIAGYVDRIRKKEFKTPEGREINVDQNTPAYGYLVCDITPKIDTFCKDFSLTKSPDGKGYFGYHANYQIYFEVISFDKLVSDTELRNKIFFKKLGIDQ